MSVVGPRPSPEAENSLFPSWRDARLSVRPGITGLWQVCRTREAGRDFQEWVYYDKMYVSRLSAGLDAWICWKTLVYVLKAFLKQF
jgi:lipopolysaccharide/colanic/teichoic acid biosynthesis glycosyltransferase